MMNKEKRLLVIMQQCLLYNLTHTTTKMTFGCIPICKSIVCDTSVYTLYKTGNIQKDIDANNGLELRTQYLIRCKLQKEYK